MEDHPTVEDFKGLLQQSSRPRDRERNVLAVRHILSGCKVCRSTLQNLRGVRELLARVFDIPRTSPSQSVAERYNYEWAFARTERAVSQYLSRGSPLKGLPETLSELDRFSEGEQIRRVSAGGQFANPEIVQCLLDRSHSTRYQNPRKTLHFAVLARLAAESCAPEMVGGYQKLADLQAEAWGALGNAQRISGSLVEAEEALETALKRWEAGSHSERLRARLLSKLCSLRLFQRRYDAALTCIEDAEKILQAAGEPQWPEIVVQKANAFFCRGDFHTAAGLLQGVILQIDPNQEGLLYLAARHNLFRCYVDLDRPDEALALHVESRDLYQKCNAPLILFRATWQEGKLLGNIGHLQSAEAALVRAYQGFEQQDLAYEAALVLLDLAHVYRKLGRFEDVRKALDRALPIFRSLRVSREVLATLLKLQQAAEEETSGRE